MQSGRKLTKSSIKTISNRVIGNQSIVLSFGSLTRWRWIDHDQIDKLKLKLKLQALGSELAKGNKPLTIAWVGEGRKSVIRARSLISRSTRTLGQ
jgi:hypothetical protein